MLDMADSDVNGIAELAGRLVLDETTRRAAIGDQWSPGRK